MKLIRLKINSSFRSLQQGFEIKFHSPTLSSDSFKSLGEFHPFCFAGLNGTGKSNVLEAIASIFYHMECCALKFQPDNFRKHFNARISTPDAFELEYFLMSTDAIPSIESTIKVKIEKNEGEIPIMKIDKFPFLRESDDLTTIEVQSTITGQRAVSKGFLPEFIIAYSSGENETLSIPFIKMKLLQYDEYIDALEKNEKYEKPESGLLYMDYELSQAVLLANVLFQEEEILASLREELGIVRIKSFRLYITLHKHEFRDSNGAPHKKILTEQLNVKIEKLKNCATSWFQDEAGITIDFYFDKNTKDAVKSNFDDAFSFFQTLKIFYVLNHRIVEDYMKEGVYQSKGYYTENKIPVASPEDHAFYFLDYYIETLKSEKPLLMRQLSDGEHQFLYTMGICLLLRNQRSIMLLDEPETHFNPDWRSKFIKILKNTIATAGSNNLLKEIVLTSHSPFIISDCLPDKVVVFEKNEHTENKVICKYASEFDPPFNTYGTAIDIIVEKIFKNINTIGEFSKSELQKIDFDKIKSDNDRNDAKKSIAHLGDSIEKDLTLIRLNKLNFNSNA